MQLSHSHDESESTFRAHTTFLIMLTGLVLLAPFSFANIIQGHHLIGIVALVVAVVAAINSWEAHRGHSRPSLITFGLAPGLTTFLYLALQSQGVAATYWIYPALIAYYCMLSVRRAQVLNFLTLLILLPPLWSVLDAALASRVTITLLAVSLFCSISSSSFTRYHRVLESKATTDPLTGLLNRTLLNATLNDAITRFQCQGTPMTLLLLDLDDFKAVNDNDGHAAGDRVLAGVADILKKTTRVSDSCFRLGGEELLCVLEGAAQTGATRVAERIRAGIEAADFATKRPTTASIGVSTLKDDETWQQWLARADAKLYEAKRAGKNRII